MVNLPQISISYSGNAEPVSIKSSLDASEIAKSFYPSDEIKIRESFYLMLLNRANKVIGYYHVSTGGIDGTVVDPRLVFSVALTSLAAAIILVHNHPSGNTKPSNADIAITEKLKKGGELLEISVLDHIIITPQGNYYSFADEGML